MFNTAKSDVKENAEELIDTAKDNVKEISADAKKSVTQLSKKVKSKSLDTKEDALALLSSIRAILDAEDIPAKANELTDDLVDQATEWKDVVQKELVHAFKVSKTSTERLIRKRSFLALSVAVVAGVAIGYLLAPSAKEEATE
ncbi:MAG: hypothetical protein ACAH12_09880 [Methylophilaceae bacterium]